MLGTNRKDTRTCAVRIIEIEEAEEAVRGNEGTRDREGNQGRRVRGTENEE
jgi:hypothetical protein